METTNHPTLIFIKLNIIEFVWRNFCYCSQSARNENGVDLKLGRGQLLPKGFKIISGKIFVLISFRPSKVNYLYSQILRFILVLQYFE